MRVAEPDAPVVGARVELQQDGRAVAQTATDADGRYHFARVPHGAYRLRVTPPAAARHVPVPDAAIASTPALTRHDVTIDPVVLAGTITSADRAIAGAEVRLAGSGERAWTNASGAFRLVAIEPGERTLLVTLAGAPRASEPVTVRPSTTTTIDIDLSP